MAVQLFKLMSASAAKRIRLGSSSVDTTLTLFDPRTKSLVRVEREELQNEHKRQSLEEERKKRKRLLFINNHYENVFSETPISLVNVDLTKYTLKFHGNRLYNSNGYVKYDYRYMDERNIFKILYRELSKLTFFVIAGLTMRRLIVANDKIYFDCFQIIYDKNVDNLLIHFPSYEGGEVEGVGSNYYEAVLLMAIGGEEREKMELNLQVQYQNTNSLQVNLRRELLWSIRRLTPFFIFLWFNFTNVQIEIRY